MSTSPDWPDVVTFGSTAVGAVAAAALGDRWTLGLLAVAWVWTVVRLLRSVNR